MFAELVGLAISWIAAVLSNSRELLPKRLGKRGKQTIAALLMLAATIATAISLDAIIEHHDLKNVSQMPVASARHVQEASGATLWNSPQGPVTLVVDDEVAAVIRLDAVGPDNFGYARHYWLRGPGDAGDVKDLEGLAASADGRFIYAVASHSYALDPKDKDEEREEKRVRRSYVIRGCIPHPGADGFLILDKVPLTAAFEAAVINGRTAAPFAVPYRAESDSAAGTMKIGMEIEGLAADKGNLYFGFRAPLDVHGRAIMARVPTDRLFPGDPPPCTARTIPRTDVGPGDVEVLAVPIHDNGNSYGIVSMEFDGSDMVIVANSTEPFVGLRPRACRWRPSQRRVKSCQFLPNTRQPYWGKQEALVLGAPGGKATIFIDGDKGLGGWVTYDRDELGL